MNKVKKFALKGFTLMELIVVMAIFSIIMVGAVGLIDPVGKIFKSTSQFETATANMDNMKRYLEGTLRYASRLEAHCNDFSSITERDAHVTSYVNEFWEYYFKDRALNEQKGNIYALAITNPYKNGGSWVDGYGAGIEQSIVEYVYHYDDVLNAPTMTQGPTSIVNTAVYNGSGVQTEPRYRYAYYLGEWDMNNLQTQTGGSNTVLNIADPAAYFSANNFIMTIHMIDEDTDAIYKSNTASFAFTNLLDADNYGTTRQEKKYVEKIVKVDKKDVNGNVIKDANGNPIQVDETTYEATSLEMFRYTKIMSGSENTTNTYIFIFTLPDESQILD